MMLFLQSLPFFLHTTLGSFVVVLLSWSMNIVGILIPVLSFLPHRRRRWKNLGHMVCRHIDVFMTRTPCFFRFATRNLRSQDKDCGVQYLVLLDRIPSSLTSSAESHSLRTPIQSVCLGRTHPHRLTSPQ
jgi:hypothetical protein